METIVIHDVPLEHNDFDIVERLEQVGELSNYHRKCTQAGLTSIYIDFARTEDGYNLLEEGTIRLGSTHFRVIQCKTFTREFHMPPRRTLLWEGKQRKVVEYHVSGLPLDLNVKPFLTEAIGELEYFHRAERGDYGFCKFLHPDAENVLASLAYRVMCDTVERPTYIYFNVSTRLPHEQPKKKPRARLSSVSTFPKDYVAEKSKPVVSPPMPTEKKKRQPMFNVSKPPIIAPVPLPAFPVLPDFSVLSELKQAVGVAKCLECNADNFASFVFCNTCGTKRVYCVDCKLENLSGFRFCNYCGFKQ